jgi:hypothetical protein
MLAKAMNGWWHGVPEAVKLWQLLIDCAGADVGAYASLSNEWRRASLLIQRVCSSADRKDGVTALHTLCKHGNWPVLQFLLNGNNIRFGLNHSGHGVKRDWRVQEGTSAGA